MNQDLTPPKPSLYFYDGASSRRMCYVYPSASGHYAGWLLYQHADGHWVTLRKATDDDIERMNKAPSWRGDL